MGVVACVRACMDAYSGVSFLATHSGKHDNNFGSQGNCGHYSVRRSSFSLPTVWRAVLFEFGPFLRVEQLAGFKSFVCFCTFLLLKKVNEDNVKELYTRINHGYTTGKNTGSGS